MADPISLARSCAETVEASTQALRWIEENGARLRLDQSVLNKQFRKAAIAARKLGDAAMRPMCVGVFGASQAGKSYLISALARDQQTGKLIADFGEEQRDFLAKINPESKKEATGVVTRFTMRRSQTPPGYPVALQLLSETDLVKILGNTYYSDCVLDEERYLDGTKLRELLAELSQGAATHPMDGLTIEDMWSIDEYFSRQFGGRIGVRALTEGRYWQAMCELAPRLPLALRARCYALIWNQNEALTRLFLQLAQALQKLNFSRDAFCAIEPALVPREDGIVTVDTLWKLAKPERDRELVVLGSNGMRVALRAAELTALIAELRIPLLNRPWPFFEHTDLLDFPGARSRDVKDLTGLAEDVSGFFLRGKIAYLFDRYSEENELNSMLLCMPPGNNEVKTLSALVANWISSTQGKAPEERKEQKTALFVVLTKFDSSFDESQGTRGQDAKAVWSGRLHASLVEPFGSANPSWLAEWHPGQAFNNTFLLRNPQFITRALLEYDENDQEIALRSSEAPRIERYHQDFLMTELVNRHIADPARAWSAVMTVRDGGITRLAESLKPICEPEIKLRQLEGQLRTIRDEMFKRLSPYYVAEDLEAQIGQRGGAAKQALRSLMRCAEAQRFGLLLAQMQVGDTEIRELWLRLQSGGLPSNFGSNRSHNANDHSQFEHDVFGDTADSQPRTAKADQADLFAEATLHIWAERLRRLPENPQLQAYFFLPQQELGTVVDEVIAGARRIDLRRHVATGVRKAIAFRERHQVMLGRPVGVTRRIVNDYVNFLGYDRLPAIERPQAGRGHQVRQIFAPRPQLEGDEMLAEVPPDHWRVFCADWMVGFRDLVERNVRARDDGSTINVAANAALGRIVGMLTV